MSIKSKKRVLIITDELTPYLERTDFASILNKLSVKTLDSGMEIRIIMPKFGVINERRHRLHEVVRLSGINIVVDKEDHPLLIKVASLPDARLQVYFMDNEDFYKRKFVFTDAEDNFFEDNAERVTFFSKSALEIVKKFGWPPDVIHCHGWSSSLIPMFLKTAYKKEPVFTHSKIVYSAQIGQFDCTLGDEFGKMVLNSVQISEKEIESYNKADNQALVLGACKFADVVIKTQPGLSDTVKDIKASRNKKVISFNENWAENIEDLFEVYQNLTKD